MKIVSRLILEGPDSSGKSTLVEQLSELLGINISHAGGPPKSREELIERIEAQLVSGEMLLDRTSIISEQVYRKAFNEECRLSEQEIRDYYRRLLGEGFTIIYCRPPIEVMEEKFKERAEKEHKSPEHCQKCNDNREAIVLHYDQVLEDVMDAGIFVLEYDWTIDSLRGLVDDLQHSEVISCAE